MYDTCHGQMVGVVGARQEGEKETFRNQVELIRKLAGRINHIHLIDSDNTCHKDDKGEDETSAHPPFGLGLLNFDEIMPELVEGRSCSAQLVDHRSLLLARCLGGYGILQEIRGWSRGEVWQPPDGDYVCLKSSVSA